MVACTQVLYETEWAKDIEKDQLKSDKIYEMFVNQLNMFKLGEVFSAVCVYNPKSSTLNFVRKATNEEVNQWDNLNEYLNKKIDPIEVREKLINRLSEVFSEKHKHFVLYSLLSH